MGPTPPAVVPRGIATRWASTGIVGRALAVYGLSRLLTAVVVVVTARHQQSFPGLVGPADYWDMVSLWDARWYEAIALDGYPDVLVRDAAGEVVRPVYAFSPLFPFLTRGGMALTGWSFAVVGSTIALLAGFGAAAVIAVLLRDRLGARVALWSVAVIAAFPAAPVLQIAYADSLGLLLVAGFLLAVDRARWLPAAAVAVAIGFTRPLAPPLLAVLLVAGWQRWRGGGEDRPRRSESVRFAVCALAVVAGNVAWAGIAWARTGVRSAYLDSQAAWWHGAGFTPFELWRAPAADVVVTTAALVVLAVACGHARAARLGAPMRAWCLAYLAYLAVVGGNLTPTLRHLVLLFPLAPVALGTAGASSTGLPPAGLARRGRFLIVLGAVGSVAWVWVLLRYTPPSDLPP